MIDVVLNKLKLDWILEITEKVKSGGIWQYSTFITYYIFFTLFPLAVGVINAFQYHNLDITILHRLLHRLLPVVLSERLIRDVNLIYEHSSFGVYIIALVSSIWTISWITNSIVMGINKSYGTGYRRNIIVLRLLAFSFTLGLTAWLTLVSLFLQNVPISTTATIIVVLLVIFITSWFVYTFIPNAKQKLYHTLPGAVIVTVSFLLAGIIYSLLMNFLPADSIIFTLLGAFMVIFTITQKLALAILIGALANRIFIERQEGQVQPKNEDSRFVKMLIKLNVLEEK